MPYSTPTPAPRKRRKKSLPAADLRVPDVVRIAFVDNYLPVLVTREDFALDFVHVTAKLPREKYARVEVLSVTPFAARIGTLELVEVDAAPFADELAVLGTGLKMQMLRARGEAADVEDEAIALAILCALARLRDGILYAQPRAGAGVVVAFEFSRGFATPVID